MKNRDGELGTVTVPGLLYLILCVIVFLAGVIMTEGAFKNALLVAGLEILFIVVYLACLWVPHRRYKSIRLNSWIPAAIFLWAVCVTVSLAISPYDLLDKPRAIYRYQQTLIHVLMFIVVRDLFVRYRLPGQWVLLAIAASGLAIAFGMGVVWLSLDPLHRDVGSQWFWKPPFNSHIRHTGYQIAAGASLLAPFFIPGPRSLAHRIGLFFLFVGLSTFLFWMGGRGSVLGVYAAFGCLMMTLWMKGIESRQVWLAIIFSTVAGLFLSEALAVFDWNGILDLLGRTVEASDLNQVTTGRSRLWYSSWVSVREHPFFGLGPQGYFFMPNRILPNTIVTVQPHSFLVQFVVEWGFIGAALFSSLLVYGFYCGFKTSVLQLKGTADAAAWSAGTMIVALTIHGVFDGTYYHPQPSLYLAIAFAIWTLPNGSGSYAKTQMS